jgi:hypothetical protein
MVDRLLEHKTPWKRKSKHQTRPEADITNIADTLLQEISNVQIRHIKSHQDNYAPADKLSWPAQLNIIADQQATKQREMMDQPLTMVTNTTKGMLLIGDVFVTRNAGQLLWQAASSIPIQDYYHTRHGWTNTAFQQINWKAQYTAINQLGLADQQRILKFAHQWLPTEKNLKREKESNISVCPLCDHELEDNLHIFVCTNPKQVKLQQELLLHIAKQQHSKEMPEISQLLEWALSNCGHDDNWKVNKSLYPRSLHKAIESQNLIGWSQLYYGRISIEFTTAQEAFYRWQGLRSTTHNGQRWASKLINRIWRTMLSLCTNRNSAKHDKDGQAQAQHLQQQLFTWVQHCYKQADIISAADRHQLFNKTMEERLQDDTRNLQAWVASTEQIIRINRQEDPHILRSCKKMEEYFQWKKK